MSELVSLQIEKEEALLLFEAVSRLGDGRMLDSLSEEERSAVWRLTAVLEKALVEPFDARYAEIIERAKAASRARGTLISLTEGERIGVHNAVNEVCHGVHIGEAEFSTRLGCDRAMLASVLKKL